MGRDQIPHGHGVKVLKAIQGHPKLPRLWAILINKIIMDLVFLPCKHEPCLYHHPNYKGNEILFLRQVDDFAISCMDKNIAYEIIGEIDKHMTIKVKSLGVIIVLMASMYNRHDITQS